VNNKNPPNHRGH